MLDLVDVPDLLELLDVPSTGPCPDADVIDARVKAEPATKPLRFTRFIMQTLV